METETQAYNVMSVYKFSYPISVVLQVNKTLSTISSVRDVDTAVEITSIVQLGMLTVIAYVGELLLELGILQTAALILLQV